MRKRWGGCWGGLPCFKTQKGGKRIVPASRIPEGNASANQANGPQATALTNQATTLVPSLLAPPSSPASFSNSALPSTAQSPSCFLSLSANSPGGPSSTMYATGPYAHETQLVSPPVFSTFTTEPSTAPLTPPPELAHLTTPSSPDVPFAQFLSSSRDIKTGGKSNYHDHLHATYSLYPESPASSLISPVSRMSGDGLSSSFPERDFPPQWDPSIHSQSSKYPRTGSARSFVLDAAAGGGTMLSEDSNFFCPSTFAQFYLDNPHVGGRLSVSRESDVFSNNGNVNGNGNGRHNKNMKQDVEEIEAYRASFGFSADDIITTSQYVEIADDVLEEDSFTITPFTSNKPLIGGSAISAPVKEVLKAQKMYSNSPGFAHETLKPTSDRVAEGAGCKAACSCDGFEDKRTQRRSGEDVTQGLMLRKNSRKYHMGLSSSDAEIDYRRGRSLRERKGDFP